MELSPLRTVWKLLEYADGLKLLEQAESLLCRRMFVNLAAGAFFVKHQFDLTSELLLGGRWVDSAQNVGSLYLRATRRSCRGSS